MTEHIRPILAITMGDPAGIGPEIVAKALSHQEVYAQCRPLVTGDAAIIDKAVKLLGLPLQVHAIAQVKDARFEYGTIDVFDLQCVELSSFEYGKVSAQCGNAAFVSIRKAIELAMTTPNCKYVLGSVMNHVSLHQTIIGLEAEKQMAMAGEYPDIVIGCFGGGSNFSGIAFPFMRHNILEGAKTQFLAAEPSSCPKLTRGKFEYDYGDESGYTPLLPMYTLGHNFQPANIHAGGLRYHGAGPIISQLLKDGYMGAVDLPQTETFKAGVFFARHEGIIPAPESCHAIAAAIREANKCKESGEKKVILFNLSGHGLIDMAAYDQFLAGDLVDYSPSDEDIAANLKDVEPLQ